MTKTTREKEAVLGVYAAMMRPLMRTAFEYGISAREVVSVVRRTFIQTLEAKLLEQERPDTDGRLSVVSGLTRSEIVAERDAIRSSKNPKFKGGVTLEQITQVLTAWHDQPGFSGAYGLTLDLDVDRIPGSPRKTFDDLIDVACRGANKYALLEELVASGSAQMLDSKTVRCLSREYMVNAPELDANLKKIDRVSHLVETIVANFAHNLNQADSAPSYFERTVIADRILSDDARDKFLTSTRDKGHQFVSDLDAALTKIVETDKPESGKKYGVAVYFFEDAVDVKPLESYQLFQEPPVRDRPDEPVLEEIDVLAVAPKKR